MVNTVNAHYTIYVETECFIRIHTHMRGMSFLLINQKRHSPIDVHTSFGKHLEKTSIFKSKKGDDK